MISSLRIWLRKTGLIPFLSPVVSLAERYRLARICDYVVLEAPSGEVLFKFDGRQIPFSIANPAFKEMAFSEHERPTTAVFLKHIRPGDTIWDVGANIGYYTCLSATLTGTDGRICAFEPNPQNFRLLTENAGSLKLRNVCSVANGAC